MSLILLVTAVQGCAKTPADYEEPVGQDGGEIIFCQKKGGTCTASPDAICGQGEHPLTANDPANTDCLGHCCVESDFPNQCDDNFSWNCVPGDECVGGWQPVENFSSCDEGWVCCFWDA